MYRKQTVGLAIPDTSGFVVDTANKLLRLREKLGLDDEDDDGESEFDFNMLNIIFGGGWYAPIKPFTKC